jgi:hypothetical protein
MASAGRRARKADGNGRLRWIVGVSALLVAVLALYVLMTAGGDDRGPALSASRLGDTEAKRDAEADGSREALDDIDAGSRKAMRDLLREAGE